jgi:hypothetical protein
MPLQNNMIQHIFGSQEFKKKIMLICKSQF